MSCSCSCSREEVEGHSAWSAVNEFYASLMLHIFNVWKTHKTIKDSGYVLKGKVSLFCILKLKIFKKIHVQWIVHIEPSRGLAWYIYKESRFLRPFS